MRGYRLIASDRTTSRQMHYFPTSIKRQKGNRSKIVLSILHYFPNRKTKKLATSELSPGWTEERLINATPDDYTSLSESVSLLIVNLKTRAKSWC